MGQAGRVTHVDRESQSAFNGKFVLCYAAVLVMIRPISISGSLRNGFPFDVCVRAYRCENACMRVYMRVYA